MKNKRSLILLLFLLIGLSACNNDAVPQDNSEYNVKIETPIVMSKNSINIADGNVVYVNVEMISGRYFHDETAGAFEGDNWSGDFQIRVYTNEFDFNSVLSVLPISFYENQDVIFKDHFSLLFDDYNGDGNPDFTLGQYVSSNGYEYAIYTINPKGEVEMLGIDGKNLMFANKENYSIELDKLSSTSFKNTFYDNSVGIDIEEVYQWENDKFVLTKATDTPASNNEPPKIPSLGG